MIGDLFPNLFASLCGGFFVLVLLALGIFLIVFSVRSRKKAEESQAWPNTTGSITLSEVKRIVNRDDDGNESYAFIPSVEFSYSVAGQSYSGKRLAFGGSIAQKDPAAVQKGLERYPVGAQVTVYYNPEKPSEAVLERQAGGIKWAMTLGILCLVLSFCIACPLLYGLISKLISLA
jgi:hypothetical protein